MKIIKLYFYLLVCCGAAESFTEKSVDLGQNVTLKCEVSDKHVFWLLMKSSEPPVFILRSFSSRAKSAEYSNMTFSKTFSLQYNSSLFIHNISTNDLGVYYCRQTALPYDISRGIRLYIQNHTTYTPYTKGAVLIAENQTCDDKTCKDVKLWQNLFIILAIINCLVLVVITGFTVRRCRRNPKTRTPRTPPDAGLQLRQNNTSIVYADVQYIRANGCIRTTDLNCTYSLLQPMTRRDPMQRRDLKRHDVDYV